MVINAWSNYMIAGPLSVCEGPAVFHSTRKLDKRAWQSYHGSMNMYELIAPYYDLEHAGYQDDVDLYLNYALAVGSPVLEIGCGSGRLLEPLAQRGIEVVGVDSSPAMLARARAHLQERSVLKQAELIEADARALHLDRRFRLAFVALNSFAQFATRQEQRAVLAAIHEHLLPGGTLLLDLPNADIRRYQQAEGQLFHQGVWTDERQHAIVSHFIAATHDQEARVLHLTHFYDIHPQAGPLSRIVVENELALLSGGEVELLVESCGFQIGHLFGDYDLNPCADSSPRLIVVATRDTT
ncbi:MAG TPA: class I SAM-dependent methyltransferase [Ktedonobacterales bacterium]|nr:class I SAM-dependent methyltransferase [Ktedonobacterales bacterium]